MKTVGIILFFALAAAAVFAQETKPSLEVFYIDNSQSSDDYFSDSLRAQIKSNLNPFKDKKKKFILFISDGSNYQVTSNFKDIDKTLKLLYTRQTAPPDPEYDLQQLRQEILEISKRFTGNLKLHFFISEQSAKNILDKQPLLFAFFPKEIFTAYRNFREGDNTVHIYYTQNALKINSSDVHEALNFYSSGDFSSRHKISVQSFLP